MGASDATVINGLNHKPSTQKSDPLRFLSLDEEPLPQVSDSSKEMLLSAAPAQGAFAAAGMAWAQQQGPQHPVPDKEGPNPSELPKTPKL